ncbi:cysteine desulfurase family protein [Pullulanibacillus sp. KACC 23026]|uniref:cysteine desulfurase family protein n=1 Tax=Pullulanibacillus sp. KACC 23026 TaxID=3028315 RepID=UPI0023AFA795|nr:cysteine desulfurase family protein [Pullulanibacillus sp. KACC 23026]WEG13876.1 cysteine desulfurase family protein [Pullulanibacillus sp. KACC 23026]
MIYLDNSATTRVYPEVLETYLKVADSFFANPSSIHKLGGQSEELLKKTREQAARLLQVEDRELVFTSGGTEGNNLAIKGTAFYYRQRGKHLITTSVEHAASFEAFKQLESIGYDVTYLDVDRSGKVDIEQLKEAIRPDTILVSLLHVNNETGSIQDVEQIGSCLSHYPKILFHVDHVQGLTKVPLHFKKAQIDLCTMSGHKIHGPKGTGLLYIRNGVKLAPLFAGGGQEGELRSGTENLPGNVALVKALRLSLEKMEKGIPRMKRLMGKLRSDLEKSTFVTINTPQDGAPHILSLSVHGIKAEVLIHALDQEEIYISTKSACSSKSEGASRVLLGTGIPEKEAESAIRISLSFETTDEEIETFLNVFHQKVEELRRVMGGKP